MKGYGKVINIGTETSVSVAPSGPEVNSAETMDTRLLYCALHRFISSACTGMVLTVPILRRNGQAEMTWVANYIARWFSCTTLATQYPP